MRSVRWPSALCSRTRRMPAGNDLATSRSLVSSQESWLSSSDAGVLVTAVEPAQEIASVDHVEGQHPGRFEKGLGGEPSAFCDTHVPGGEPGVRVDDVGSHQGVLEIEHRQLTVGREHRPTGAFFPRQGRLSDRGRTWPASLTRAWATTAGR